MRTMKKSILLLGVFCLLSPCLFQPSNVDADEKYPTKTIKFLVPYAAGGQSDVICRKIMHLVREPLGQEMIADNKVGAAGLVAASFLAKSKPDGYTIGAIPSGTFIISPNFTKMEWDPLIELIPIIQIFSANQLLAVAAESPIRTLKDFIEVGRKRQITVASPGLSPTEVALRRLGAEAKINQKVIPFEGSAPAIMATMGGQVDAYAGGGIYEYVRAGKIRMVARFTGEARGSVKEIPSLKELGYDIEAPGFLAIFAPKGVPEYILTKLEEEFSKALRDPGVGDLIESTGSTLFVRGHKDFSTYLRNACEQAKKEFKELGLGIYAKEKK